MNTLADYPEFAADAYIPTAEDMADWYAYQLAQDEEREAEAARHAAARAAWKAAFRKARLEAVVRNPELSSIRAACLLGAQERALTLGWIAHSIQLIWVAGRVRAEAHKPGKRAICLDGARLLLSQAREARAGCLTRPRGSAGKRSQQLPY